ncbi:MAG: hypothetical protein A2202_08990 [Bdellovibrionales bacterium RIFOXYA1_FULL_36_14]|nr:MAG: hypothetical protein A2202_08990 [Bdellovibrionales bacterium RIFOXYA1_FULL_36_14]
MWCLIAHALTLKHGTFMIYDHLDNLNKHLPSLVSQKILSFLKTPPIEDKKFHIEDDNILAITSTYLPRLFTDGLYESHFKYIDLQIMISGEELVYYHPINKLIKEKEDRVKDIIFYKKTDQGVFFPITNKMFTLLYPQDGHLPTVGYNLDKKLRKVVFKINNSWIHP